MSIVAVLVNCALIGLSGQVHRMFPDMTATQTILLIVALEVRVILNNLQVHYCYLPKYKQNTLIHGFFKYAVTEVF